MVWRFAYCERLRRLHSKSSLESLSLKTSYLSVHNQELMSLRGADGAVLIAIIALVFIHNRKLLAILHFLRDLDNYLVLTFSHRNAVKNARELHDESHGCTSHSPDLVCGKLINFLLLNCVDIFKKKIKLDTAAVISCKCLKRRQI